MCGVIENLKKETAAEAAFEKSVEIALGLLKLGKLTINEICLSTKLSADIVEKIADENNIAYTV